MCLTICNMYIFSSLPAVITSRFHLVSQRERYDKALAASQTGFILRSMKLSAIQRLVEITRWDQRWRWLASFTLKRRSYDEDCDNKGGRPMLHFSSIIVFSFTPQWTNWLGWTARILFGFWQTPELTVTENSTREFTARHFSADRNRLNYFASSHSCDL